MKFAAIVLVAILLFAGLGRPALMEPDEGRNAEVAREMKESGAWLVPTLEGMPYLDKPAFYFRAVAISFSTFGESEAAARLPSALFALALIFAVFLFGRRVYDARVGTLAAMVLVTTPLFLTYARLVIMDIPLTFFVCVSIFAGYLAEESEGKARARWHLAGAVSAGLATLVKGPVGFILPALVLGIYFAVERKRGWAKRSLSPLNLIVFLGIVLAWFLALVHARPDFLHYGLVEESFHRFTTTSFRRTEPFYYYIPLLLVSCLAYSLLFPEALVAGWKARKNLLPADRLMVIWCAALLVFFSLSQSKRPGYILPVLVALAVLTARILAAALANPQGCAARRVRRGSLLLALLMGITTVLLAVVRSAPQVLASFATGKSTAMLEVSVTPLLAASVILLMVAVVARWKMSVPLSITAFVLWMPLMGCAGFPLLTRYADLHSSKALAVKLQAMMPPDAEIAFLVGLPNSLPFYMKQSVTMIVPSARMLGSNYIPYMLEREKKWPDVLVPFDQLQQWADAREHPTILMSRKRYYHELVKFAEASGKQIEEIIPGTWGVRLGPRGGS